MRITPSHRHTAALLFIAASAISSSAFAHTGAESHIHNSFLSGLAHPLFGLDHLAAMVAVGLWSALSARRAGRELLWGPMGFAAMLRTTSVSVRRPVLSRCSPGSVKSSPGIMFGSPSLDLLSPPSRERAGERGCAM